MKKIMILLLAMLLLLSGCGTSAEDAAQDESPADEVVDTEPTPEEVEPPVLYAADIAEGSYEITVKSSASMFRVVKCVLTVEGGEMYAAMTMSGQGYGYVYMGTREEAAQDTEENFIPFTLDEVGAKVFTVPVEALNMDHDCAAWSIRKETWYDRVLVFESTMLPAEALLVE